MDVWFSRIVDSNGDILKHIPEEKQKTNHKWIHDEINYKYMIAMDGWVSGWLRPSLLLLSNSVPIIVESNGSPLYFDQWIPWVHYVPVKQDLSDLV